MVRVLVTSLLTSGALFGLAAPAGAVAIAPMLAAGKAARAECNAVSASSPQLAPASLAASQTVSAPLLASKSAAILGGTGSALERIAQQQLAGAVQPSQPAAELALATRGEGPVQPAMLLVPGMGPETGCTRLTLPRFAPAIVMPGIAAKLPGAADDFLQTRRLTVSHTAFDRQWERVRLDSVSHSYVAAQPELRGAGGLALLERVNAWANRRIRYTEDARLYGAPDYWAGANATLRRGAGDCEDIAIAKLQVLAAMGVARSDLYLTIARDLSRRADHAVLVVKSGGRYWLLDNATDRVLEANSSYDYQPVLSYSQDRKWLHGAVVTALR